MYIVNTVLPYLLLVVHGNLATKVHTTTKQSVVMMLLSRFF